MVDSLSGMVDIDLLLLFFLVRPFGVTQIYKIVKMFDSPDYELSVLSCPDSSCMTSRLVEENMSVTCTRYVKKKLRCASY
jgi:hypothetical protein